MVDVMAPRAAECEDALTADLVDLTAHQMDHRRADPVDLAAVPFFDRHCVQAIVVLVVPVDEQRGKRTVLQPVQPPALLFIFLLAPNDAEVTGDDQAVILRQTLLLREGLRVELVDVTVAVNVSGDV